MARIVALYRYPVKGFTPERCEALTALPEGRVVGDRVLGFRFANSRVPAALRHEYPGRVVIKFDRRVRRR
jgi:uncharacterized protein YcbX